MKKYLALFLALVMSLSLVACGGSKQEAPKQEETKTEETAPAAKTLSLGTASLGGNFFTMGAAMAAVIIDGTGVPVTAQATGGSVYNVGAVNDGELDIGMAQASAVASGVNGKDAYEGAPTEDVRTLINYNATPVHILVNKSLGATSVADLKGAKLECLAPGDGIELATMSLLPLWGISLDDVTLEYSGNRTQASSRMKTGQVDAILDATGLGAAWIADIYGDGSEWDLLTVSDAEIAAVCEALPEYSRMVIPAGTYNGQTEDAVTVGLWTTVFCHADLDDDTAYGIVKALMEGKEGLVKAHSFFADLAPENVVDACQAPLHPGAEKYYKEVGVI